MFKHTILLIFSCTVFINNFASGSEVFTSATQINQALVASRIIATELKQHLENEVEHLHQLRSVINRLENATRIYLESTTNKVDNDDHSEATANPVSSFLTILHLAANWSKDLGNLLGVTYQGSQSNRPISVTFNDVEARKKIFHRLKMHADFLPGTNDVEGASDAILRLQKTYAIPAINIADGKIVDFSKSPKLTDIQCFDLAKISYNNANYANAEQWFRVILDRINNNTSITGNSELNEILYIPKEVILEYISFTLGRQGRYKAALEITKQILDIDPYHQNAVKSKRFYEAEIVRFRGNDPFDNGNNDLTPEESEITTFEQLCRGENTADTITNPKLICKNTVPHPYFIIHPIKLEIMQDNPRIVLFHEFVNDNEVKYIQQISKRNLKRATVRDPKTGKLITADYRITKNFWIPNDLSPTIKSINKRIAMVTGLNMDHAEELQVANYGLGGHYAPHFDHARNSEMDSYERLHGNRIATFMVYLTNVEAGGSTVFTKTKAHVKPVGKSAVFWYNLLPSGESDDLSRHGACPVLIGSKWVVNKWIRQYGQEFVHPCQLSRYPHEQQRDNF